jgi:murein DD-endopeptidase MepM/ murein hydrolase activator NlpD
VSAKMSYSKPPQPSRPLSAGGGRQGWFSRLTCVTFIYIPNESATSRRIRIPKVVLYSGLTIICVLLGLLAALSANLVKMASLKGDYEKLRVENMAIRSEAAALVAKLQEVKSNLAQVDHISNQVRQEAASLDPRNEKKKRGSFANQNGKNSRQNESAKTVSTGPLEYGSAKAAKSINVSDNDKKIELPVQAVGSAVKLDNLEFRDLFAALTDIRDKSSVQLQGLSALLRELQTYRVRLSQTPTISPVQGLVTSFYGVRSSPFSGQAKMHQGVDIAAPMGSPIRSAANGTVIRAGTAEDYGNYIEIAHGYGVVTRYAHAQKILVKAGTRVSKGDLIGLVGSTGRTTGPHLHYEVEVGGRKVDPSNFIRGL